MKRSESGMTLIEALISSVIFVIVLSMVLIMITTLDSTTTEQIATSQEAEQAQTAASFLEQYLGNTVPPMVAATSATPPALSSASPCWGGSQPSSGTSLAAANSQMLPSPSRVAITVAHDFDLVFCAYKPESSTPHVYEAHLMNCTSSVYGNCTLKVADYGTSCTPGTGSPNGAGCANPPSAVESVPHVWCDAYCQGTTGAGSNPQHTSVPRACWDVPANTVAGCAGHTPPLFEYFGDSGQYGSTATQDQVSINYEVENSGSGASLPAACSTGTGLFIDLVDNSSGCDDASSDLGSIQLIVFNVTILDANGLPVSTATSKIGSQVDNQVLLGNELTSQSSCGANAIETAAPPAAYYPLDDTGTPLDDLGTSSDSQAGTGGAVSFNQTPGPLPCNLANGGMKFDGSSAYAYSPSSVLDAGFGTSLTLEAWFDPQTAGSSCTSDCAIISDGDATESSGYKGAELVVDPSWKGVAVGANGQSSAGSTGLEPSTGAFTTSCPTPDGPGNGCWYLAVGVISISGTTMTLTTYLCGPSVPTSTTSGCSSPQTATKTGYSTITYAACDLMVGASPYSGSTTCNSSSPGTTPPAQYFAGYVADATIYKTALTANQITTQFYEMSQ